MIDQNLKKTVLETLQKKILADTGHNVSSCKLEFKQSGEINVNIDLPEKKLNHEIVGKDKFLLSTMVYSKIKKYILNSFEFQVKTNWVIVDIDFESKEIKMYSENVDKQKQIHYKNLIF